MIPAGPIQCITYRRGGGTSSLALLRPAVLHSDLAFRQSLAMLRSTYYSAVVPNPLFCSTYYSAFHHFVPFARHFCPLDLSIMVSLLFLSGSRHDRPMVYVSRSDLSECAALSCVNTLKCLNLRHCNRDNPMAAAAGLAQKKNIKKKKMVALEPKWPPVSHCLCYVNTNSNGCRRQNVDFFRMVHMWHRKFNNFFSHCVFYILFSRLCSSVDCEHFLLVRISKSIL